MSSAVNVPPATTPSIWNLMRVFDAIYALMSMSSHPVPEAIALVSVV
jgi:hypothetical protein